MKVIQYKKLISLVMGVAFASVVGVGAAMAESHDGDKKHMHKGHHFFKMMDSNGDGQISAEEHAAAAAKRFARMDSNGDGMVTKAEMKAHHKAMKEKWAKHAKGCHDK